MKKFALLLALSLTFTTIFAGCGNSASSESSSESSASEEQEAEETASEDQETEEAASEETTDDTAETSESAAQVVGGWTIPEDLSSGALTEDQLAVFEKGTEAYTGMGFVPVAYLGSQVVSGTNHMYLCMGTTVTANPESKYVVVTIYQDLDDKCEITNVADFDLGTVEEQASESTPTGLAGGWAVSEEYNVINMEADVEQAFENAIGSTLGATYEPLALLGSKVVNGTEYAILCHYTLSDKDSTPGIAVVFVWHNSDGTDSVSGITGLDISSYSGN